MSSPFTISMKMTHLFFDRAKVKRSMDRSTHQAMRQAAGSIRKIAQQSMRYVSPKSQVTSRPGESPRARRPHPWVRKFLWFYYDPGRKTAVIGPVRLGRATGAPHNLEFGGRVRGRNPRRHKRKMGRYGEVRIVRLTKSPVAGRDVIYSKLTSPTMVARANELNKQLYGPDRLSGRLAARPFMGPALRKETPKLPRRWANSVRG